MFKQLPFCVVWIVPGLIFASHAVAQQPRYSGRIVLAVPADAVVHINNRITHSKGVERLFESGGLQPGKPYRYGIRVTLDHEGKKLDQTKSIVLRAGEELNVAFTLSELAATTTVRKPPSLPKPRSLGSAPPAPLPKRRHPRLILQFDDHSSHSWRFSADGGSFATLGDRGLTLWDVKRGSKRCTIPSSLGFKFSPSGKVVASWDQKLVSIHDSNTGDLIAQLEQDAVHKVQFIPQTDLIATFAHKEPSGIVRSSIVSFWNAKTWKRVTSIGDRMTMFGSVLSRNGKYVGGIVHSSMASFHLKLWEIATGKELLAQAPRQQPTGSHSPYAGFTHSGDELYLAGKLWNIAEGKEMPLPDSFNPEIDVAWNTENNRATPIKRASIIDRKIVVRDVKTGVEVARYDYPVRGPKNTVTYFDRALAVTDRRTPGKNVTVVLDPGTGRELMRVTYRGATAFSQTGETFAAVRANDLFKETSGNWGVDVWETRTGRKIAELPHDARRSIHLSPDGKVLATEGPDVINLWQVDEVAQDRIAPAKPVEEDPPMKTGNSNSRFKRERVAELGNMVFAQFEEPAYEKRLPEAAEEQEEPQPRKGLDAFQAKPVVVKKSDNHETKLMKQRYNVAVKEMEVLYELFSSGASGHSPVSPLSLLLEASRRVLASELDLASSAEQRIAAHSKAVEAAKAIESVLKEKCRNGAAPINELHRATFNRLTAELWLVRGKKAAKMP